MIIYPYYGLHRDYSRKTSIIPELFIIRHLYKYATSSSPIPSYLHYPHYPHYTRFIHTTTPKLTFPTPFPVALLYPQLLTHYTTSSNPVPNYPHYTPIFIPPNHHPHPLIAYIVITHPLYYRYKIIQCISPP